MPIPRSHPAAGPRLNLKTHREQVLAWSQVKAAQQIGVHPSTLWRWESGLISTIRPYDLQLVANAYGLDYAVLAAAEQERLPTRRPVLDWDVQGTVKAFATLEEDEHMDHDPVAGLRTGDDLASLAHTWVSADPVTDTANTGTSTRVDLALVEHLEGMVLRLRHLDDEIGGADLLPIVRARHRRVTELLAGTYTSPVGRRLHATAADLGQLLGWLAFDTGIHGLAQRQWIAALHAAHSSTDAAIGANIMASMALQLYALGRPHDGLSLAQSAEEGLGAGGSTTVRAMIVSRQAVAAAKLGDTTTSSRALYRAEALLDSDDPNAPAWIYYYGRADEQLHAGTCWLALNEPARAEVSFRTALDSIDATHIRDRGVILARIAHARINQGEIEAAAAAATDALLLATSQLNSLRASDELADVDQALTRFLTTVPAAADFHEHYITSMTANPT